MDPTAEKVLHFMAHNWEWIVPLVLTIGARLIKTKKNYDLLEMILSALGKIIPNRRNKPPGPAAPAWILFAFLSLSSLTSQGQTHTTHRSVRMVNTDTTAVPSLNGTSFYNHQFHKLRTYINGTRRSALFTSGLTSTRVPFYSGGLLVDDADMTFTGGNLLTVANQNVTAAMSAGTTITSPRVFVSDLVTSRLAYSAAGGELVSSNNLQFDGTHLTHNAGNFTVAPTGANTAVINTSGGTGAISLITALTTGTIVSPKVFVENVSQASTNSSIEIAQYDVGTSGTPAAGIGINQEYRVETQAANFESIGRVSFVSTDVTNAAEYFDFMVEAMHNGTLKDVFHISTQAGPIFSIGPDDSRVFLSYGGLDVDNPANSDPIFQIAAADGGATNNGGQDIVFDTGTGITNGLGGDVVLTLGAGAGSGRNGALIYNNIPVSNTDTNVVWSNGGMLTIGTGPVLTGSATIDFPDTAPTVQNTGNITVTGAAAGDVVSIGTPGPPDGTIYSAYVSASNTVTVTFTNAGSVNRNPASGTFKAIVFKY